MRGIRIIPRTDNFNTDNCTVKQAAEKAKIEYNIGGAGRVQIPTIYLSLSRLYPLGERKESVYITEIKEKNAFYQNKADEKYKEWYNYIIPNSIKKEALLSKVEKRACSRASLHMDINNTPTLSQSIGQDNVGNIISALVDIYMLSLEDNYNGALLCIDEIDVSLHPDTQIRLLELFNKVADELNIQFVVSTHSLTVLKETLKNEKKDAKNFKVVYLKNISAPYVTESKTYELLKADMFDKLTFKKPKVKVYFEDEVGKTMFNILLDAYKYIFNKIDNVEDAILRNSDKVQDYAEINDRIHVLKNILKLSDNINQIVTKLGCDQLLKVSEVDDYFKRIIFVLDGDARYVDKTQNPLIREYLDKPYYNSSLSDRKHTPNICFLPDHFAPESFLYKIIYTLYNNPNDYLDFWRGLDSDNSTALYTAEKIKQLFSKLPGNYTNDDIKKVFSENIEGDVWQFIKKSDIVTYYYSDYTTVKELLIFLETIKTAYNMCEPLTIENKYN